MIFCPYCRQELPDDATFCLKCGKPLKGAAPSSQAEPLWEYCSIETEGRGNFNEHVYAKAVGPRGTYRVGQSLRIGELSSERKRESILNELINSLIASGWEPLPKTGPNWGDYRFRRRVDTNQSPVLQHTPSGGVAVPVPASPSLPQPQPRTRILPVRVTKKRSLVSRVLRVVGVTLVFIFLFIWETSGFLSGAGFCFIGVPVISCLLLLVSALQPNTPRSSSLSVIGVVLGLVGILLLILLLSAALYNVTGDAQAADTANKIATVQIGTWVGLIGVSIGVLGALLP